MTNLDETARLAVEAASWRLPADDDLPMTTFGPLVDYYAGGYVANEPTVLVGEHVSDYVVPRRVYERIANDNVPVAPQLARLDDLRDLPGFIYLGSPYSKYRLGYDAAAYEVSVAAAQLMGQGFRIYAPISHGHFVNKHGILPQTWDFWKDQCQPMIDAASALIVLQMHGWSESVGLTYEIEEFQRAGKPIFYLDPKSENMRVAA